MVPKMLEVNIFEFLVMKTKQYITRWRLSNHRLHIETGRYAIPKLHRSQRFCKSCVIQVEDEDHIIFRCNLINSLRGKYHDILSKYVTLKDFLNPSNAADARRIGSFLIQIEKVHDELNMKS